MINRQQQRGVSLIGMLFWGIVIVFVALVAMKLVPAYTEFFTVKKIISDLSSEAAANSMSNADIRDRFAKRAMIDNVKAVAPADLQISREGGKAVIAVSYTFHAPLVANVSLLVDFAASSDGSKPAQ